MSFRFLYPISLFFILVFSYSTLSLAEPNCSGGPSTGFKLKGAVVNPKSFTPASLGQYQASKMTVSYFSGSAGLVTKTYVGVPLYDLIKEAIVITDSIRKNDILRKYLVINATDCYQVIVAIAEILPNFGGEQAMVAFATVDSNGDIVPLDSTEGAIRIVIPGDKSGGRYVSNVNSIFVRSAP